MLEAMSATAELEKRARAEDGKFTSVSGAQPQRKHQSSSDYLKLPAAIRKGLKWKTASSLLANHNWENPPTIAVPGTACHSTSVPRSCTCPLFFDQKVVRPILDASMIKLLRRGRHRCTAIDNVL